MLYTYTALGLLTHELLPTGSIVILERILVNAPDHSAAEEKNAPDRTLRGKEEAKTRVYE